jgi:hypothetical protein
LFDGPTVEIKSRFGRRRRIILDFRRDYLPEYAGQPLPPSDAPIRFAGLNQTQSDQTEDETGAAADPDIVNSLDEPGARQFMAALGGAMDDGGWLRVRRLNQRQFQVSFDRSKYTARDVIGRILEQFEVDDLELREPELEDIIRAIYDGRHVL